MIVYLVGLALSSSCEWSPGLIIAMTFNTATFLLLFLDFYRRSYLAGNSGAANTNRTVCANDNDRSSVEKSEWTDENIPTDCRRFRIYSEKRDLSLTFQLVLVVMYIYCVFVRRNARTKEVQLHFVKSLIRQKIIFRFKKINYFQFSKDLSIIQRIFSAVYTPNWFRLIMSLQRKKMQ